LFIYEVKLLTTKQKLNGEKKSKSASSNAQWRLDAQLKEPATVLFDDGPDARGEMLA